MSVDSDVGEHWNSPNLKLVLWLNWKSTKAQLKINKDTVCRRKSVSRWQSVGDKPFLVCLKCWEVLLISTLQRARVATSGKSPSRIKHQVSIYKHMNIYREHVGAAVATATTIPNLPIISLSRCSTYNGAPMTTFRAVVLLIISITWWWWWCCQIRPTYSLLVTSPTATFQFDVCYFLLFFAIFCYLLIFVVLETPSTIYYLLPWLLAGSIVGSLVGSLVRSLVGLSDQSTIVVM